MKPRILFNAKDHPTLNSGYGILSRYLLPRLGDHYGRDRIIIYSPIYEKDRVSEWEGMTVVSGTEFSYGENLILEHYQNHNCNLLLQVGDAWPLGLLPDLAAQDKVLWVQWLAVDWLGMPKNILYRIKYAHKLVSFSKYGERSLRKAGLPNVEDAIWIGLNTDIWRPMPREELPDIMDFLGYSWDSFNILIVGANQERKRIRHQLEAISLFMKLNPQVDTRLYLHSFQGGDRDFRADVDELGLENKNKVVFPEGYTMSQGGFPEEIMVKVFNCADVVMNVCMEGFGLSQTQAQACGVPVICLSEGAGPELTYFGWETPPLGTETSRNQMTIPFPSPAAVAACLGEAWQLRVKRGSPLRSDGAIKFVQSNFNWDEIASQWIKVIDKCMEDRERYCMDIPEPSGELDRRAAEMVVVS